MPRDGTKNLKPLNTRSKDVQKEIQEKGREANKERWAKKTAARDVAKMILSANIPVDGVKTLVKKMGLPETELNVQAALIAGQAMSGIKGNDKSARLVLELSREIGDNAETGEEAQWNGIPARVIGKGWSDIYRDILDRRHTHYDFPGGRGSLKSSFCGLLIIDDLERNKDHSALVVRQIWETMRDSVYAQIVWAIDELGLNGKYVCTKSPLQIRRRDTNQTIFFRGADDPMKIKSLRPPNGQYIGIVWNEEADQVSPDSWRNILQSALRGGDDSIVMRSYNTPRSKSHYINIETLTPEPSRIVWPSNYLDAPKEWLGQAFYDLADELKSANEQSYLHEYMGEPVGTGASVFENIAQRTITDDDIARYDRIYNGVDWGFSPDCWAFVRCYFHAATRKLYIFDEAKEYKKGPRDTGPIVKSRISDSEIVTCDSTPPENTRDYNEQGIRAVRAVKGPGSVIRRHQWLQGLSEIVIDAARCPNTYREFSEYEYERTKTGELISGYPDKDNHFIDAVCYSTESIWRHTETPRKYLT